MSQNEEHIIKNNIKTLRVLNEHVNRFDIVDAIKNREVVKIYYQGDKTVNRGYRTIEPHVLGRTKDISDKGESNAGNMVVRAWQQAGASDTHNVRLHKSVRHQPKGFWRLFRLDGISQLLPTGKQFEYYDAKADYEPNGDAHIDVALQVDYDTDVGVKTSGFDSLDAPDTVTKRVTDFDPDAKKSKDYSDDVKNSQEILKHQINSLFDMVKKSYKKSVHDYIVVNRNNKMLAVPKYNRTKYEKDEIVGNLTDLAKMFNQDDFGKNDKAPKTLSSLDSERSEFEKRAKERANQRKGDKEEELNKNAVRI